MAVIGVRAFSEVRPDGLQPRGRALGKVALALSVSAAALILPGAAIGQETQLPGIDVQGVQAKKASASKAKSKPKPSQSSETQAAAPATVSEGGDQATTIDAPYAHIEKDNSGTKIEAPGVKIEVPKTPNP